MEEYKTVEENEKDFQDAYENYWHGSSNPKLQKQNWDKMFLAVLLACTNITKRICCQRKIILQDLDEVSLDAAMYCMKFIGRGIRPRKLSSYCYLRVRYILDMPSRKWYDKNIVQFPQDNYKEIDMEIEGEYGC